MSELEKTELTNRVKGMGNEELDTVCRLIPSDMLLNELGRRFRMQEAQIAVCKESLKV